MMPGERHESGAHQALSMLLPWYVNETLGEADRERLEVHLADCLRCREDLALERQLYRGLRTDSAVEFMPTASLKRLHERLDAIEIAAVDERPRVEDVLASRPTMPWAGLAAASVAVLAVAVSVLATQRWLLFRSHGIAAPYQTVTQPAPQVPGETIRAVFAPTITLVELQAILDEAQLRIVAGPSEAGVYALAPTSQRPTRSALASLRAHSNVKFAESIQTDSRSDATP